MCAGHQEHEIVYVVSRGHHCVDGNFRNWLSSSIVVENNSQQGKNRAENSESSRAPSTVTLVVLYKSLCR